MSPPLKRDPRAELNDVLNSLLSIDGSRAFGPIPACLRGSQGDRVIAELGLYPQVHVSEPPCSRPLIQAAVDASSPVAYERAIIHNVPIRHEAYPRRAWIGLGVSEEDAAKLYRWDEQMKGRAA